MTIEIGKKIRELRAQRLVTQEQLAVFLGVTPQAVSRWEAGYAYPDMELLPAIADYFSVTTDELLGLRKEARELRLAEIKKEIRRLDEVGTEEEILTFARQAVAEFPSDESLQLNLANALQLSIWAENPDKAKIDEAEKILMTVYETTKDIDIKCEAIEGLVMHYTEWHKDDARALEMADRLPTIKYCREVVKAWFIKDGGTGRHIQQMINLAAQHLTTGIQNLILNDDLPNDESTWETKIQMLKTSNAITKMIYGDDMMWHHGVIAARVYFISTYQLAQGKTDEALSSLEEMAEHAIAADKSYENDHGKCFTSPFVNTVIYPNVSDQFHEWEEHNQCWYGLDRLKNSRWDGLRDNERFQAIVKELESRAK